MSRVSPSGSCPTVALPDWRVHEVASAVRFRVNRALPPLAASLEAEVERLWSAAQARTAGALFNGRVFSADVITPALIEGHWTEYRRVIARMDLPELAAALHVRPVSVNGVILGGEEGERFVLFGRRPARAVYQAGEWQLPPAGSLDPGAADRGEVDPIRQLLTELREELGLPSDAVSHPRLICLVEHPGSGALDLGIAVNTRLSEADLRVAHCNRGNGEYQALSAVRLCDLPGFLARNEGRVTRQAPIFLRRAGVLASQPIPPSGDATI